MQDHEHTRTVSEIRAILQAWRGLRFSGFALCLLLGTSWIGAGCAGHRLPATDRSFRMHRDSLAYANELVWEYHLDPATGEFTHVDRDPPPTYSHHCFVVAKTARQFFEHARFDSALPRADEQEYRKRIRRVTGRDPSRLPPAAGRIVIPGYANLYEFSQDWETLLKKECGGAWRSYTQRGHWRMVFPFSRTHQERTAERLRAALDRGHPPVVHVVNFPELSINHAVVLIGYEVTQTTIVFETYDPNTPEQATALTFDKAKRTFQFPRNDYYVGGDLNVYEIYRSWNY